jgi:RNA polymerase sigma-70 factor (ECF subfamily)
MLTRRTGDPARAEDLAQETFLRAMEAPPARPRPWLFAVALNLARDEGRRAVRQERHLALYGAEQDRTAPAADEALERNDRRDLVRTALERLTETDRSALLMKAEGLNYEEIASALGLSSGAIGTTLARARKRLVEAVRDLERGNDGRAR